MGSRLDVYRVEDQIESDANKCLWTFLQCSDCGGIKMKKGMPPNMVAQLSGRRGKGRSM